MQTTTTERINGKTIRVHTDEHLDWKIYNQFDQAAVRARHQRIEYIEIDLRKTRVIQDSGLTMLLMLINESGLSGNHITLVNCRPKDSDPALRMRFFRPLPCPVVKLVA